jgi:hypothetical protein
MSKNVLPGNSTTFAKHNSTEFRVIGSTGQLYSNNAPINYAEIISWSSDGVSPSTATAYGITNIAMTGGDPSTSPALITLAAPMAGVEKTIVVDSTAAYINTIDLDLGATVRIDGSSDNRFVAFSTLATAPQSLTLVGLSATEWAVKSVNSTLGQWGLATGIRGTTVARTS